jgi:hypothetical protein
MLSIKKGKKQRGRFCMHRRGIGAGGGVVPFDREGGARSKVCC